MKILGYKIYGKSKGMQLGWDMKRLYKGFSILESFVH